MSTESPAIPPEPQEATSPWSAFAENYEEMPVADDGQGEQGEEPQPPADVTPATPAAPVAPEVTPPQPPGAPVWEGQEAAGRSFAALREEQRKTEATAAYWRGVAEGRIAPPNQSQQQAPATDEDDIPDPQLDPAGFVAYVVGKTQAAVLPAVRQLETRQEHQDLGSSLDTASREVGQEAFGRYWGAVERHLAEFPSLEADILAKPHVGRAIVALGRQLLGEGASPAAPAAVTPPAAPVPVAPATGQPFDLATAASDPRFQEAVLRALAAKQAADGTPPPSALPSGPRGFGPGGSSGVPDGALPSPEAIRGIKDPEALRNIRNQAFGKSLFR